MPIYSSPNQRTSLSSWLLQIDPVQSPLAWCHTTDTFQLRSIVKEGVLCPQFCRVFDEEILYCFYGRPAFRRHAENQIRLSSKAPTVIILKHEVENTSGRRLFPFDSGAFGTKYSQWLHSKMQLSDFELECRSRVPQRFVKAFFGSNDAYLNVRPSQPELKYSGIYEVESVVEILRDPTAENADDRRLALELQVGEKIPFTSNSVMALIVPDELLQAEWFNVFRFGPGRSIDVITYELQLLKKADHYQALLESLAMRFHKAVDENQTSLAI